MGLRLKTSFYGRMSLLILAIAIAGFWASYFSPLAQLQFAHDNPWVHWHAVSAGAWVVLFVVQTHLAANENFRLHKAIGLAALVVIPATIIFGSLLMLDFFARLLNEGGADSLLTLRVISLINLTNLLAIALLTGSAFGLRRSNGSLHKRFMLMATILFAGPALLRIAGALPYQIVPAPLAAGVLLAILLLASPVHSKMTTGRFHRSDILAALLAIMVVARVPIAAFSDMWGRPSIWLASLG